MEDVNKRKEVQSDILATVRACEIKMEMFQSTSKQSENLISKAVKTDCS